MTSRRPNLRIVSPAPAARDGVPQAPLADTMESERLLARHGLKGLRSALSVIGPETDSGWTSFWRGYVLQFDDLGAARAAWLSAESRFAEDDDAAGIELAACALVQCTLLDYQSYDGFDVRAERVAHSPTPTDGRTPLAWFRLAARLLLAAERREDIDGAIDDVERAFAALGADVDREIALRVATAALPM